MKPYDRACDYFRYMILQFADHSPVTNPLETKEDFARSIDSLIKLCERYRRDLMRNE